MPIALIVLNVLLAVTVVAGIVGMLAWSIATQAYDHPAKPAWRASHKIDPTVVTRRHSAASFDASLGTETSVGLVGTLPRAES